MSVTLLHGALQEVASDWRYMLRTESSTATSSVSLIRTSQFHNVRAGCTAYHGITLCFLLLCRPSPTAPGLASHLMQRFADVAPIVGQRRICCDSHSHAACRREATRMNVVCNGKRFVASGEAVVHNNIRLLGQGKAGGVANRRDGIARNNSFACS